MTSVIVTNFVAFFIISEFFLYPVFMPMQPQRQTPINPCPEVML